MDNDLDVGVEQDQSQGSSETPEKSDSSWRQRAERVLSLRNIALLFIFLGLITLSGFVYLSYSNSLTLASRSGVVYLSTISLFILYALVLSVSVIHKYQVRHKFRENYDEHNKFSKEILRRMTDIFATLFLPFVSILLVLSTQIIKLPTDGTSVVPEIYENLPYMLSFYFSSSVILLMIGMEVSYSVQEHSEGHQWPVLVMASLILDFISYFIIVVGYERPQTGDNVIPGEKVLFTFLLGTGSLISSYYTVTQARITDEILGLPKRK